MHFHGYHMGTTAENVAQKWQITREEQDRFAVASQNKAEAAQKAGRFKDEIAPVTVPSRKGDIVVAQDEYIRAGTTLDAVAKLKPAFSKDGTVTAGNASGPERRRRGARDHERVGSQAPRLNAACEDRLVGNGRSGSENHGFWADSSLAQGSRKSWLEGRRSRPYRGQRGVRGAGDRRQQRHGLETDIVNVNGGAIAIGHPIGASGARILVTLLHEMQKRDAKRGLATLCIGGGMGIALAVER